MMTALTGHEQDVIKMMMISYLGIWKDTRDYGCLSYLQINNVKKKKTSKKRMKKQVASVPIPIVTYLFANPLQIGSLFFNDSQNTCIKVIESEAIYGLDS
jgi:hypothetical protein